MPFIWQEFEGPVLEPPGHWLVEQPEGWKAGMQRRYDFARTCIYQRGNGLRISNIRSNESH